MFRGGGGSPRNSRLELTLNGIMLGAILLLQRGAIVLPYLRQRALLNKSNVVLTQSVRSNPNCL